MEKEKYMEKMVYMVLKENTEVEAVYVDRDTSESHKSLFSSKDLHDKTFPYFNDLDPQIKKWNYDNIHKYLKQVVEEEVDLFQFCENILLWKENKAKIALEEKMKNEIHDLKLELRKAKRTIRYKNDLINKMKKEKEVKLLEENIIPMLGLKTSNEKSN